MYDFETGVKNELLSGAATSILYAVLPVYSGKRVVPYEFDMYAIGWNGSGEVVYDEADSVKNVVYLHGNWVNLGMQSQPGSGGMQPVPTS
jgi:hypothetical protein